jgi:hypothetical protein
VANPKDYDQKQELQSHLLRLDERVLELTQRLDNAVGKLVSLAQLVRESTSSQAAMAARLEQLQAQVDSAPVAPTPERDPAPVAAEETTVPVQTAPSAQEPDFGQVVGLLRAGESDQARRTLGRIPTTTLQDQPVLHTLTEAALNAQTGDIPATIASLEQAQRHSSDPRLAEALLKAQKLQGPKN